MVHVVAVLAHVAPPGEAVTVYPVIAEPPVETGAVHATVTTPLVWLAVTPVGAVGARATDHLSWRYSSTWRRSATVSARSNNTTSATSKSAVARVLLWRPTVIARIVCAPVMVALPVGEPFDQRPSDVPARSAVRM